MQNFSSRYARLTGAAVLTVALAACGGGKSDDDKNDNAGNGDSQPVQPADPTTQGRFEAARSLGTVALADINAAVAEKGLYLENLQPRYAVTSYRIEYLTVGATGQTVKASGLVSVPNKPAGAKSPVLSYQHGTIFRDAEAPSNNAVASEISVVMASLGYIVLAPDYVGYGVSKGVPHPYLQAAPMAASVIDFLTAAKTWRQQTGVYDNQQLFLTGYSEGGYATMAAHRALQAGNLPHLQQLRMVVPGAGPYNVQATLDSLIDIVRDKNKVLGALIQPGFLKKLGGSAQREVRRALLKELIPDDADTSIDALFLDNFLSDDVKATDRLSNVHNWRPQVPVYLYHGRDDQTVPYASSTSTLAAMQAQGASDLVSLSDCPAAPSSHLGCVAPFLGFMLGKLALQAQDL
ncbi:MAG: prolyl oligopeptidase family serine peptidase [Giesbergeria sp.]|nr:prolyl oligopeptidase family serine peptidase [Giesbergeria sp.]MBP6321875.1 prolyl oligopeptidase family serine peptidase [Giesbergeria sp.]MBP6375412.1 prolyl oligopeptidase family serine peptidase [Giesbergeria sp.]MBP7915644.1 prolyl oligopeptidase family serine peptidase [Giesbergeria sp.]MBP8840049.1 prolyl oligopeptidase family serine peptidase [Giesbergeria sp.]